MKTAFRNLAFAAASFLVLASCKKSVNFDDAAQAIPKNATSVTAMNLPSLMQKADFESVKQMDFYKEAIADADKDNPTVASIMRDPKKSGVDFTKNVYFVQDYNLGGLDGYGAEMTILMSLTDAAAFEAIVKSGKTDVKIETKDGVKYVINMPKPEPENAADGMNFGVKRSNSFVAWTDKMAVVGGGTGENTEGGDLSFLNFFKTKADESIAKNAEFSGLFATEHDIYSYMSFDKLADNTQAKAAAGAMNLDPKALKGNYATSYGDFDNGQIVSKSDYQINSELRKQWGLMFKDNVKTDFSKYLKGQNIGFAATLALDVKGLKEIINANPQFRMMLERGNGSDKFSTDDVFNAFDGDLVIAAAPSADKKWQGMIGFKLSDKKTMEKLVNFLVAEKTLISEGNGVYKFGDATGNLADSYVDNGKVAFVDDVIFAGDAATVASLRNGGDVKSDVKDVLNKNIFGIYANFAQIFSTTDGMKDPEISEMKMTLGGKHGESTFKTRDANENSLKSLLKAANRWYLKSKAEKAKMESETKDANKAI